MEVTLKKRRFIEQDTQKRFIEACRIGDVNIVRQLLKDEDVDPAIHASFLLSKTTT